MTNEGLKILSQISILIVEDDEIAREILIQGLKPYCRSVFGADNGISGLACFEKFSPDIILSDIHMPQMNGFEMIKKITKWKPHQKFIIFTSYDTDTNLVKSLDCGAKFFLKKPINIEDLIAMIIGITYEKNEKLIRISDLITINLKKEKIYKNGNEIYLTFLQNKLFWLFAYNLNKLVTYEMIEEFVYDNENVSKSAIQNVILRLKRELQIKLKNISESGYILMIN